MLYALTDATIVTCYYVRIVLDKYNRLAALTTTGKRDEHTVSACSSVARSIGSSANNIE